MRLLSSPVLYVLLFLLPANCCFAVIRYVNINNPTPGAGTSWATAYTDLNAALAVMNYGDQIWVAQGTYKPTTTTNRSATFTLKFGYDLYGGFNGTETALGQRNPQTNVTILSGDIGVPGDASDNSYHVITCYQFQNGRVIDGFTIRDGNANAGYPGSTTPQADNTGGGILVLAGAGEYSYADLENDLVTSNFAVYGGGFGVYGNGAGAQTFFFMNKTRFNNNSAVTGGAVSEVTMNGDWTISTIQNCIFTNNNSISSQGSVIAGLVNNPYTNASTSVNNCTLYNNSGPVIYNQEIGSFKSNIAFTNVIIWQSGAPYTTINTGPSTTFDLCDLDLATPPTGGSNIYADPLFVNAAGNDFHLTSCSPCVDKGWDVFGLNTDFDGNTRPQGAAKDIGAYEFAGASGVPAAPTAPAASFCQNATATALTATGTNLLWYTSAIGGTGSSTAPVPSTAATGTTTYYVTQTPAGCESTRTPITVTIKSSPAAPTTTAATPAYCQNATATALTATGTNLLWYTVATNGTGSSIAPVPPTTSAGSTTWYVSQTSGGCESLRTPITVTINGQAAAPGVSNVTYCQNASATALTATGSSLLWYTGSTGGSGNATAPVPNTSVTGSTTYYVSQTPSGFCESSRASITVTISTPSTAPGTSPVTYCENATAVALTATGSNLTWYTGATGGTGTATAPVPNTATAGSTTWYVTQTPTGSCESARTPIAVTIKSAATAPAASNVSYCQNASATALTATGSNLQWYTAATGGSGTATAPIPATTSAGSTTYYVTQTPAGSCESNRAPVTVTINAQASVPGASNVAYCQNASATALTATGSGLLWYTGATGGSGTATAPVPNTAVTGSTTWYVSQTPTGFCESNRAAITVTVNNGAPAPGVSNVSYCQNATASALTATGSSLLWYAAATGGTGNATAPTPNTGTIGTFNYYVSQTVGCESPRAVLTVTISNPPAAPIAASPVYCQNDAATALAASGTNLLWYTTATGGTGSATAPVPSTGTPGSTTWYVSQNSGCESSRAAVVVTVNANPVADFSFTMACTGDASVISAIGSATTPDNYTWNFNNPGIVSGSGAGPYNVVWSTPGAHTVTVTATTGACSSTASHNVTVYPLPTVGISAASGTLCPGNPVTLTAYGATSYVWSPATGLSDPTISNPVAIIQNGAQYMVTGTDDNGCTATAQITLQADAKCLGYYIPDGFTPNGDGKNDVFRVITVDIPQSFHLTLFNRYGQKVFETTDVRTGWNGYLGGTQAVTGAYVYIAEIKTSTGTSIEKKGTVMLVR